MCTKECTYVFWVYIMNTTFTELRNNLKFYIDQLEHGEVINIIRYSVIVGHIVPSNDVISLNEHKELFKRALKLKNKNLSEEYYIDLEDDQAVDLLLTDMYNVNSNETGIASRRLPTRSF